MLIFLLLAPIVASLTFLLTRTEPMLRRLCTLWSTVVALLAFCTAVPVLTQGTAISWHALRIDAFAAIFLILVGFVQWTATLVSGPYLKEELHEKLITFAQARLYHVLLQLFVFSMLLALAADNIGVMWIALEGTTLATTLLVAFYTHEGSLEAAWKYIMLCSVGISLGLLGVLLVYYAATTAGLGGAANPLSWIVLRAMAHGLSPTVMRWAFVFIFIGYGAKVGLVPMHTWLPDAHGRTPSPISGMLSGVLLNIALFAILRYKGLVDAALGGPAWTNQLFILFGALSFMLPAAFILVQRNYKRLLAYSSIEHMGFAVFCFGFGAPGAVAGLIHLIGHSLIKSMLFFGTGNILLRWKSTKVENIGPVLTSLPYTGAMFLVGMLALLAAPPSPIFLSEYLGFAAATASHPFLVVGMLLAATVVAAGFFRNLAPMLLSRKVDDVKTPMERWNISHTAMALHLVVIVLLGAMFLMPSVQAHVASIVASFM